MLPQPLNPSRPPLHASGTPVTAGSLKVARPSAFSTARTATGHVAVPVRHLDPIEAAVRRRDLARTIDAEIEPYIALLHDAVEQHGLRVPDNFGVTGADRQAAYAEAVIQDIGRFRDQRVDELMQADIDAAGLRDAFKQAARKDWWMGFAGSAVEKTPQAAVVLASAVDRPWTNAASRADSSQGPLAGAIVGGLTGAGAGVLQAYLGAHMKGAVLGRDPFFKQPALANVDERVATLLDALPRPDLGQKFKQGWHASRGMDWATAGSEAVGLAFTANGAHHQTAVNAAIGTKLPLQLLGFGLTASRAVREGAQASGQYGNLCFIGRRGFLESLNDAMQPMASRDNAIKGVKKAARVAASTVTWALPRSWTYRLMDLPAPRTNTHPPIVDRIRDPSVLAGAAVYAVAGAAVGAGNGAMNRAYGSAPTGSEWAQIGNNLIRSVYTSATATIPTVGLMVGNVLADHLRNPSTLPVVPAAPRVRDTGRPGPLDAPVQDPRVATIELGAGRPQTPTTSHIIDMRF